MKSFREFVTEGQMTVPDALKIFGFSGTSFSLDDLKQKYKKLAVQHHPDVGGDQEMMKKVNAANDILLNVVGGSASGDSAGSWAFMRKTSYQDRQAEDAKWAKIVIDLLLKEFQPQLFQNHFKSIFGEDFSVETKTGKAGNGATLHAEFANSEKTTVCGFSIYADYLEMRYHNSGLSTEGMGIKISVSTMIYHNRRKIKLLQNDYSWKDSKKVFSDPNLTFPAAKLGKRKDTEGNRKMSKRDIILTFQKELGATVSTSGKNEWLTIPLLEDYNIVLWRGTFMGAGFWGFHGLFLKRTELHQGFPVVYFQEDETTINMLVDFVKKVRAQPGRASEAVLSSHIGDMLRRYKAEREKK